MASKPLIAVVSPFVDRQHGTERCLAEQLERLAAVYEIHLYSSSVRELNLEGITWHHVPALRGPAIFSFSWFFAANHFIRWRDRVIRKIVPEVLYSPGINCFDATAISIHIVFRELRRGMKQQRKLRSSSLRQWPVILHRKMYYGLAALLERLVYSRSRTLLVSPSQRIAAVIERNFHRTGNSAVIYHGCDSNRFQPKTRQELRQAARQFLNLQDDQVAVLLIGNDWRNKGLGPLVEAVAAIPDQSLCILAVGKDDPTPYREMIKRANFTDRIQFLPPRPDVEFYYAAADIYAGPSAEDAFALPPLEAMACGLPVITSRNAGVSEIVNHGDDGFILEDSSDAGKLSNLIQNLASDPAFRERVGNAAVKTASQFTWERNASQLIALLQESRRGVHRTSK